MTRLRTKLIIALVAVTLAGCASMSPTQKKVAIAVGTAVFIGAIAAYKSDHDAVPVQAPAPPPCFPQPNGTCR